MIEACCGLAEDDVAALARSPLGPELDPRALAEAAALEPAAAEAAADEALGARLAC
jgi:hypothetical protein